MDRLKRDDTELAPTNSLIVKLFIGVSVYLVIVIICSFLINNLRMFDESINVLNYFDITSVGPQGGAELHIQRNKVAPKNDELCRQIIEHVSFSMSQPQGLSNGQSVVITVDVDKELQNLLDAHSLKLNPTQLTYFVSDLTYARLINPFEGFSIYFELEDDGTYSAHYTLKKSEAFSVSEQLFLNRMVVGFDRDQGLRKGERVSFGILNMNQVNDLLNEFNVNFDRIQTEVIVE